MGLIPDSLWELMRQRLEAAEEAFDLTNDMINEGYPDYLVEASSAAWDRVEKLREAWDVEWSRYKDEQLLANDPAWQAKEREKLLMTLPDGQPCGHPGCLSHVSHPCEGCGRIAGVRNWGHDDS